MMQELKHLRDFMTQEVLNWMPGGNFQTDTFILLKESVKEPHFHTVVHVFDKSGTFIGTIEDPHFIPKL